MSGVLREEHEAFRDQLESISFCLEVEVNFSQGKSSQEYSSGLEWRVGRAQTPGQNLVREGETIFGWNFLLKVHNLLLSHSVHPAAPSHQLHLHQNLQISSIKTLSKCDSLQETEKNQPDPALSLSDLLCQVLTWNVKAIDLARSIQLAALQYILHHHGAVRVDWRFWSDDALVLRVPPGRDVINLHQPHPIRLS